MYLQCDHVISDGNQFQVGIGQQCWKADLRTIHFIVISEWVPGFGTWAETVLYLGGEKNSKLCVLVYDVHEIVICLEACDLCLLVRCWIWFHGLPKKKKNWVQRVCFCNHVIDLSCSFLQDWLHFWQNNQVKWLSWTWLNYCREKEKYQYQNIKWL